jgi:hypothetical protein
MRWSIADGLPIAIKLTPGHRWSSIRSGSRNPTPTAVSPMTTAKPTACYSAVSLQRSGVRSCRACRPTGLASPLQGQHHRSTGGNPCAAWGADFTTLLETARLLADSPVSSPMDITVGLGRLLCRGASALTLPLHRCYDYSGQRTVGALVLIMAVLLPMGWWLVRSR